MRSKKHSELCLLANDILEILWDEPISKVGYQAIREDVVKIKEVACSIKKG